MTFGEKLKNLRKEKKMSIKELSIKSGVTTVSINNYEHGYSTPSLINIQKLTKALDCEYDELFELR